MQHLGDITKIQGAEIPKVDIITFGSPCQDMSVAGKRAGLAGERSGLFMEAVRIIKEMRGSSDADNIRPRFAVWENVPGAYSSNEGEDFRAVLEELIRVKDQTITIPKPAKGKWLTSGAIVGDGYSLAWRTLDAQYWGVPQRRRRIFLVADFSGQSAPEILLKREGLFRNSEAGRSQRQGTPAIAEGGIGTAGFAGHKSITGNICYNEERSPSLETKMPPNVLHPITAITTGFFTQINEDKVATLLARDYKDPQCVCVPQRELYENHPNDSRVTGPKDICPAVTARWGTGGGNVPFVTEPVYSFDPYNNKVDEPMTSLGTNCGMSTGRSLVVEPAYCLQGSMIGREEKNGPQGDGVNEEVAFTLNTVDRHAVAVRTANTSSNGIGVTDEVAYTVDCGNGQAVCADVYAIDQGGGKSSSSVSEDISPTLACTHGGAPVVFAVDRGSFCSGEGMNRPPYINEDGINSTLTASGPGAVAVEPTYLVRRLTPLECERLQGFPDFWTDTVFKGKPASDCARYKALGNSVAEVCVEYVAEGISEIMPHAIEGSLFDGIAGFPLAFAWKGIHFVWASEIEEFCVALTQDRMDSVGKQLAMIKIRGY